jgi:CheY-like chemotaxis protein
MQIEKDPRKWGTGKAALIVDDSPKIRKVVAEAFRADGFETCAEAENGQQGIETAKQIRPDIIVLDLSMPVMNGLQAAPELRRMYPRVPIILFTLYGDGLVEKEASEAGVTVVVTKTEPLPDLLHRAHELIGD